MDFYIADSCNSRIVKYSRNGHHLISWPTLDIPHSLELNEPESLVCTCGYKTSRIECFDLDGNDFKRITLDDLIYSISFPTHATNMSILYVLTDTANSSRENRKEIKLIQLQSGDVIKSIEVNLNGLDVHDVLVSTDATKLYFADLNSTSLFRLSSLKANRNTPESNLF